MTHCPVVSVEANPEDHEVAAAHAVVQEAAAGAGLAAAPETGPNQGQGHAVARNGGQSQSRGPVPGISPSQGQSRSQGLNQSPSLNLQ